MPQQPVPTVENHFSEGLKTEFTGLNFPENAATDTQNCVFSLIGDTTRRGGINYETNFVNSGIVTASKALSSFRWLNAGGDGSTQLVVQQIGNILSFFQSSNATAAAPLSSTRLASAIDISTFLASGSVADPSITECQYTFGNGYLFVFHPNLDPFYCTFTAGVITANLITVQTRDFVGIPEPGVADNFRPTTLSNEHSYNLQNQGWTSGSAWTASVTWQTSGNVNIGSTLVFTINSQTNTTSVTNGQTVQITSPINGFRTFIQVTSYVTPFTSITGTITNADHLPFSAPTGTTANASLVSTGFINTWFAQIGNYPSNSDIWWLYKNSSGVFAPSSTIANVQQPFGPAPKGSFILNEFQKFRSGVSGLVGLTDVTTTARPRTGTWFQGRVWYAGVDASFQPTGDAPYSTWTENVYFSQIAQSTVNFGRCYQTNDPTAQTLFALLPSDGGSITIQGSGAIYKLFALRFGVLVFAANGIWFISGSSGVGFSADDFTVTKISNIQTVSGTSFIEVQGYPMFWNEEGIYQVTPASQPGSAHSPDIQLDVQNLTLGTILSFYQGIPLISKKFARGDYHQVDYIVQWLYRSTNESGISNRYDYDFILAFNTVTKAFYPYTLPTSSISNLVDIKYIQSPGGSSAPSPAFKYATINGPVFTFSEENDFTRFVDFFNENIQGFDYTSYFIAGYNLSGQALRKIQMPYVYIFSRNPSGNSYFIQSIWDYAGSGNSGRFSTRQRVDNVDSNFTMLYRRHRLRGRGLAAQIKISSVSGKPFDIMGWSIWNEVNVDI